MVTFPLRMRKPEAIGCSGMQYVKISIQHEALVNAYVDAPKSKFSLVAVRFPNKIEAVVFVIS